MELEVPASAVGRKLQGAYASKARLYLFSDAMISYIEDSQESIKKLLNGIFKGCRIQG